MVVLTKGIARIVAVSALAFAPALGNAQSEPVTIATGPAVGQKIPDFEALDQSGRPQTFATLKGPKGLLLLFYRSADW